MTKVNEDWGFDEREESFLFLEGRGQWPRCRPYEIVERFGRGPFIRPSKSAEVDFYTPSEEYPQILGRYLNLANSLDSAKQDKPGADWKAIYREDAQRIITFANHYGLLGLFWHNIAGWFPSIHDEAGNLRSQILFKPRSLHGEFRPGLVDYQEYAQFFFPGQDPPPIRAAFYREEGFLKKYAEPVPQMSIVLSRLLSVAKEWARFREGRFDPNSAYVHPDNGQEDEEEIWSDCLEGITGYAPVGLAVKYDIGTDTWKLDWRSESLISVVSIMFPPQSIYRPCAGCNAAAPAEACRICDGLGNRLGTGVLSAAGAVPVILFRYIS